jgi:hypothetical protein
MKQHSGVIRLTTRFQRSARPGAAANKNDSNLNWPGT